MRPPSLRRRLSRRPRRLLQVAARHAQSSAGRRPHLDAPLHRRGRTAERLNAILYEDFTALRAARRAEDKRISRYVDGLSEADLARSIRYPHLVEPGHARTANRVRARPFLQSPDPSPRPGARLALEHDRQRAHAELRPDHLSARNRARGLAPARLIGGVAWPVAVGQKARAMLVIDDLTVRIAGRTLLQGAAARIPTGARVGLVGRNGTGKTTLFRVIAGDIAPEHGSIALSPRCAHRPAGARGAGRTGQACIDIVLAADRERTAPAGRGRDRARSAPHRRDPDAACRHRRACRAGARRRDPRRPRLLARRPAARLLRSSPAAGACASRSPPCCSPQPDLLLLDEPTNYLDLEGTLWLRGPSRPLSAHRDRHQPRPRSARQRGRLASCISNSGKLTLLPRRLYGVRAPAQRAPGARPEAAKQAGRAAQAPAGLRRPLPRQGDQGAPGAVAPEAARQAASRSRRSSTDEVRPIAIPAPEKLLSPPIIALDDVAVGYEPGTPVLRGLDSAHRRRRPHRAARRQRQRQVDAGQAHRRPARADAGHGDARRPACRSAISRSISSTSSTPQASPYDHVRRLMPDAPEAQGARARRRDRLFGRRRPTPRSRTSRAARRRGCCSGSPRSTRRISSSSTSRPTISTSTAAPR